jgi:hypothetical protein
MLDAVNDRHGTCATIPDQARHLPHIGPASLRTIPQYEPQPYAEFLAKRLFPYDNRTLERRQGPVKAPLRSLPSQEVTMRDSGWKRTLCSVPFPSSGLHVQRRTTASKAASSNCERGRSVYWPEREGRTIWLRRRQSQQFITTRYVQNPARRADRRLREPQRTFTLEEDVRFTTEQT